MVVCKVMPWSLQRGIILKFDEALRRPGILREQRGRGACVVCAQQFWKHELKQLILFTHPDETELPKQDHVAPNEQERLCDLLGVTRYLDRWRHINGDSPFEVIQVYKLRRLLSCLQTTYKLSIKHLQVCQVLYVWIT